MSFPGLMTQEEVERVRRDFMRMVRLVDPPPDDRQSGHVRVQAGDEHAWLRVLTACRETPMGLRDAAFEVLAEASGGGGRGGGPRTALGQDGRMDPRDVARAVGLMRGPELRELRSLLDEMVREGL